MIVSIEEAAQLKREARERFAAVIRFCDSCGGQSFTVDDLTEELKAFITAFFAERQQEVVFSGNGFTVR